MVLTFLERLSHNALPKHRKRETLDAAAEVRGHYFEQHTWGKRKGSVSLNQSWTALAKKQCTMVTVILNKYSLRQERPSLR